MQLQLNARSCNDLSHTKFSNASFSAAMADHVVPAAFEFCSPQFPAFWECTDQSTSINPAMNSTFAAAKIDVSVRTANLRRNVCAKGSGVQAEAAMTLGLFRALQCTLSSPCDRPEPEEARAFRSLYVDSTHSLAFTLSQATRRAIIPVQVQNVARHECCHHPLVVWVGLGPRPHIPAKGWGIAAQVKA